MYNVEYLDAGVVQPRAGNPGQVKEFTTPPCMGSYVPVDWDSPLTPSDYTGLPLVLVTTKPTPHFSGRLFCGARYLQMEELLAPVGVGDWLVQRDAPFGYQP